MNLATMKSRIASELRRSNIAPQIADAINSAIAAYQTERFFFSETRAIDFNTVANQHVYTDGDVPALATIIEIDHILIGVGGVYKQLLYRAPLEMDLEAEITPATDEPKKYTWFSRALRLYPAPNSVYPAKIVAHAHPSAPASDTEANNPWMVEAESLIRCRAKYELYEHVLMDDRMAERFSPDNPASPTARALNDLRRKTASLHKLGGWAVQPTAF